MTSSPPKKNIDTVKSRELFYLTDKGYGRCEEDADLAAGFADEVSKLVHE